MQQELRHAVGVFAFEVYGSKVISEAFAAANFL
jgi:hypothetical protein